MSGRRRSGDLQARGRGGARRLFRAALVGALAAGCALGGAEREEPRRTARPDLAASLVELGSSALAGGRLEDAEARFERALEADPGSLEARVGLGRVALAAGRPDEARTHLGAALDADPGSAEALLGLGMLAARAGRSEEARRRLQAAVEADPWSAEAHAQLASLTGPAPEPPKPLSPAEAEELARRHPYDVRANLRAAEALARTGRTEQAVKRLEGVVWIADLDPASSRAALLRLAQLDPSWGRRVVVPVHSWADETIRDEPGWRFRLRLAWLAVSQSLDGVLGVRFVPASFHEIQAGRGPIALQPLDRAFRAQVRSGPEAGILAAFTERPPPQRPGRHRLGQAEFLGRRLLVRLEPEPGLSRVLAHEVLHLYGAVHVADEAKSLMTPDSDWRALDGANAAVVRSLRRRRFGAGELDENVFPWIDLETTTRAYENVLRLNLAFRRLGFAEALEAAEHSRFAAGRIAREVRGMDEHLGDVSRFLAGLLLRGGRPATGIAMLETAARLYGPRTPQGLALRRRAAALRQLHFGADGPPAGANANE